MLDDVQLVYRVSFSSPGSFGGEGGDFSFRFFMALYESEKKLCHMSRFYADRVKAGQKKKNIKPEIESPT